MDNFDNNYHTEPAYAGFWLRFVAYFIDAILYSIVFYAILNPILNMLGMGIPLMMDPSEVPTDPDELMAWYSGMIPGYGFMMIISWLYYALFESSAKQATPGKMALGLKVVDYNGSRISFMQATGRFFGKILSSIIINSPCKIFKFKQIMY